MQIEAKTLEKEKKMKIVLKDKKDYLKFINKQRSEKRELILKNKKAIAVENAARLEKLKRQLESSVDVNRNSIEKAIKTEVKAEVQK